MFGFGGGTKTGPATGAVALAIAQSQFSVR
jgi:hypothetical protein